jgi:hypothetical protein
LTGCTLISSQNTQQVENDNIIQTYERNGSIFYRENSTTYTIVEKYDHPTDERKGKSYEKPQLSPNGLFVLFSEQGHEGPATPYVVKISEIKQEKSINRQRVTWFDDDEQCAGNIGTRYEANWLENNMISLMQNDPECGPYVSKNLQEPWILE